MKNRLTKVLALIGACALTVGCMTGCGNSNNTQSSAESSVESSTVKDTVVENSAAGSSETESSAADSDTELTGSITMIGSTSMEKLANALAETFMEKNPGVTVSAEFVGSSAGIEAVLNQTADIGNSSRNLKDEEKQNGAVENVVAIDGIAVCVDASNTVKDLTKEQLADIYTGKVTNWKDLGGSDTPIVVVGREAGSGTRDAFEELVGVKDACTYANELDSTGAVIAKVASTPGAIGYASLDAVDDSVITVALEGVEATAENIKAGNYFLSRPFVMATNGEIEAQSELVKAWFEFVLGEEGQSVAATLGLITID
ncbi:MAG: phosphate ABC transporter substrate-binding protein [Lachnospiraceae bacterium]|nr:phosphate ABC transporter substrate-binding protein [Lachnospiraceae bacterium]MBQ8233435.1 phosphate ABC transporter substrate-binding protein [Lachnospiraceae bacterium]